MKLSRLGVGALVFSSILTLWLGALGACSSGDEACGIHGIKNGTCRQGPACPSGQVILSISDPADECPQSSTPANDYVCCVPVGSETSSSAVVAATSSSSAPAATKDAGTKG